MEILNVRIVLWAGLFVLSVGCGGPLASSGQPRTPYYHSSLTSPYARPLLPRYATEPGSLDGGEVTTAEDSSSNRRQALAPRDQMTSFAQDQLAAASCDSFGQQAVEQALRVAAPGVKWTAAQGLSALVRLAENRRAYRVDGSPRQGDVVLFHNTHDANGDNQNNDWLSGAGVVVEAGSKFAAVVCAGGHVRQVHAWPDGPSVREYRGEIVNSFLRVPSHADPPGTAYLSGSLYAGHIDIERLVD